MARLAPYALSLRLVEEMLLERGIVVSYETVRPSGDEVRAGLRPPPQAQEAEPSPTSGIDEVVVTVAQEEALAVARR